MAEIEKKNSISIETYAETARVSQKSLSINSLFQFFDRTIVTQGKYVEDRCS